MRRELRGKVRELNGEKEALGLVTRSLCVTKGILSTFVGVNWSPIVHVHDEKKRGKIWAHLSIQTVGKIGSQTLPTLFWGCMNARPKEEKYHVQI